MHFFHPRFSSTQSLQSALEARSEWAKAHAAQVSTWPQETLLTISDSRTSALDFSALQHAVEAAMGGQACVAIEWVAEGGANQVRLPLMLSLRCGH
jgi:hypothetical protein